MVDSRVGLNSLCESCRRCLDEYELQQIGCCQSKRNRLCLGGKANAGLAKHADGRVYCTRCVRAKYGEPNVADSEDELDGIRKRVSTEKTEVRYSESLTDSDYAPEESRTCAGLSWVKKGKANARNGDLTKQQSKIPPVKHSKTLKSAQQEATGTRTSTKRKAGDADDQPENKRAKIDKSVYLVPGSEDEYQEDQPPAVPKGALKRKRDVEEVAQKKRPRWTISAQNNALGNIDSRSTLVWHAYSAIVFLLISLKPTPESC